jgi:hypothetical protein
MRRRSRGHGHNTCVHDYFTRSAVVYELVPESGVCLHRAAVHVYELVLSIVRYLSSTVSMGLSSWLHGQLVYNTSSH